MMASIIIITNNNIMMENNNNNNRLLKLILINNYYGANEKTSNLKFDTNHISFFLVSRGTCNICRAN